MPALKLGSLATLWLKTHFKINYYVESFIFSCQINQCFEQCMYSMKNNRKI
jgi:hypothetical protein